MPSQSPSDPPSHDESPEPEDTPTRPDPGEGPARQTGRQRSAKVTESADATASLDDEVAGLVADLSGDRDAKDRGPREKREKRENRAKQRPADPADTRSGGGRRSADARPPGWEDGPEGATLAPPDADAPELGERGRRRPGAAAASPDVGGPRPARGRFSLSGVEIAGIVGIVVIFLGLAGFLIGFADSDVIVDRSNRPSASPETPVRGDLVALDSIEAFWRPRTEDDRVDQRIGVLPAVRIGLAEGAAAGTAHLKIHFLDTQGRITGDVRTARVENGRFVDTGRGERLVGPDVLAVAATSGMPSETTFVAYRFSDEPRWSVEIFEGEDYAAGPWNRIAWFEMPNVLHETTAGDAP